MKHLKLFKTSNDYLSFTDSKEFVTPNISLIEGDSNGIYYHPYVPFIPKSYIKCFGIQFNMDEFYGQEFTPLPISCECTDDYCLLLFDENCTDITVGPEIFVWTSVSKVEFGENVRYIDISAFEACDKVDFVFNSMTPPEFIGESVHLAALQGLNGTVYYPAGADYSSLRNVTDSWGIEHMFANYEFVEFNK